MVGKGEGSIGGVEMTEGVGEKVGGGEPLHGISRPVITMRGGPRGYRSPIQPPIHGEVKISPNDAVPAHPCQKWAEALLNEKFLSNRVTRGEVRVDEEEGVTSPKTSHVEEAPIRRPCHSIIPPHDAEEAIGDPVLPNEGSNPKKPPFLFVVAKLYYCNIGYRHVAQETQRLEISILAPRSAVQLPLHARSLFASPGLHARSPLSRPPSRERSLPRLLSFPRADREKEGSSLLTRKVRKVGSAPARRLRSLRSPPPRDDIWRKTELAYDHINPFLPSIGAVERLENWSNCSFIFPFPPSGRSNGAEKMLQTDSHRRLRQRD